MKKSQLIKSEKDFLKHIYTHQMPKNSSFPAEFEKEGMKEHVNFCISWIYAVCCNKDITQPNFSIISESEENALCSKASLFC